MSRNIPPCVLYMLIAETDMLQNEFAEKVGISASYLSQLAHGVRKPSEEVDKKIREILNYQGDDLYEMDTKDEEHAKIISKDLKKLEYYKKLRRDFRKQCPELPPEPGDISQDLKNLIEELGAEYYPVSNAYGWFLRRDFEDGYFAEIDCVNHNRDHIPVPVYILKKTNAQQARIISYRDRVPYEDIDAAVTEMYENAKKGITEKDIPEEPLPD